MKLSMKLIGSTYLTGLIFCFSFLVWFAAATNTEAGESGCFYMVSVGVGDPDNITVRALKTIKDSDIVFCDKEMEEAFKDALAGKEIHPKPKHHINRYLMSLKTGFSFGASKKIYDADEIKLLKQKVSDFTARVREAVNKGKVVSYLENGDPAIYGPNIWMMDALKGIKTEIVPGISCFNAANAALKKGLTFGIEATSAILTNGAGLHEDYHGEDSIEKLASSHSSMIFFSMFIELKQLVKRLIQYYPVDTPIAIVNNAGYREKEEVIKGTLDTILKQIEEKPISSQHLIYVGDFMKEPAFQIETEKE